jgi:hypothetical protein
MYFRLSLASSMDTAVLLSLFVKMLKKVILTFSTYEKTKRGFVFLTKSTLPILARPSMGSTLRQTGGWILI